MVSIALISLNKTLLQKVRAIAKERDLAYQFKDFKSFDSIVCESKESVAYDAYIYDEKGIESRIEEIMYSYDLSACPIILLCEEKEYADLCKILENISLNGIIFSANNAYKDALNIIHHLNNILPSLKLPNLDDPTSFKHLVEKAPDGICIIKDHEMIYANLRLAELLHYTKNELIGTSPRDYIFEADLPKSIENYQARIDGEYVPSKYPLRLSTKNGSVIRTEINVFKLKIKNELAIAVFIRDITDLFEKERDAIITKSRLKSIFHSLEDIIFILDQQDRFTFYNSPKVDKLYVEPSEFIGKTPYDILPEYIHTEIEDALKGVKKGQHASFEYNLTKDNTKKWYKATLSPIFVENIFDGTLAIIRDITSEKEYIKREEFLSSLLMHDMRNKLHIINAYVDLLNQNELEYSTKQFIRKITEAVEEGQDLISQIGQIKKDGHSRISVNLKKDLTTIIQTRLILAKKVNDINVNVDTEEVTVSVCTLFKQVLINLIDNAIQHAKCSNIYISAKEKMQDKIVIKIEDDGVGVQKNEYEKIFKKHYRRKKSKGTGLGLYFSRFIVEKYLGKIYAEKSEYGGLCVTIELENI